jgi:hypothetical protein
MYPEVSIVSRDTGLAAEPTPTLRLLCGGVNNLGDQYMVDLESNDGSVGTRSFEILLLPTPVVFSLEEVARFISRAHLWVHICKQLAQLLIRLITPQFHNEKRSDLHIPTPSGLFPLPDNC